MADEVGQGLVDLDVHSGDFLLQLVLDLLDDFLPVATGFGVDGQDVFGIADRFGVLIQLGPAGPADEVQERPGRVVGRM